MIAGEVRNPSLTIPLALLISIPTIIICYLAVNFAYLAALPIATLLSTESAASVQTDLN